MIKAIRGAVCAENTFEGIGDGVKRLLGEIFEANGVGIADVISVTFSCTKDLDAVYPAVFARDMGLTSASLMCLAEMDVAGSIDKCIRVQVLAVSDVVQDKIKHVYLGRAKILRPDLNAVQIAIDGPSGSGKSTIAKALADALALRGFIYIDSGALYRAVGLCAARLGISLDDENSIAAMADNMELDLKYLDDAQHIFLNGEDVTLALRTADAANAASSVARHALLRAKIVEFSRELARGKNIIMDGRDIGTVVFPNAPLKIYLDASVEARARRRCHELSLLGRPADFEDIAEQIAARDKQDSTRDASPLTAADDAHKLDTTEMNIEQVLEAILKIAAKKGLI
jgi:cytidylate kinase